MLLRHAPILTLKCASGYHILLGWWNAYKKSRFFLTYDSNVISFMHVYFNSITYKLSKFEVSSFKNVF